MHKYKYVMILLTLLFITISAGYGDTVKTDEDDYMKFLLLATPIIESDGKNFVIGIGSESGLKVGESLYIYSVDPEYLKAAMESDSDYRLCELGKVTSVEPGRAVGLYNPGYDIGVPENQRPILARSIKPAVGNIVTAWHKMGPDMKVSGEVIMKVRVLGADILRPKVKGECERFTLIGDKIIYEMRNFTSSSRWIWEHLWRPDIVKEGGKYKILIPFSPEIIEILVDKGPYSFQLNTIELEITEDNRKKDKDNSD
ncbi:MAG: hypothetical protein M1269_08080 [Chloroflexi bacterium]|nr:hypothetical protein [Chloroflexota bacterium]